MLVLSRKSNQEIQIGGDVTITVLRVRGDEVRLGITAPRAVPVLRGEVLRRETRSLQVESFEVGGFMRSLRNGNP